MSRLDRPWHRKVRLLLRVGGPLILILGILLIGVGMVDFFAAMGGDGPPRRFWTFFLGMPFVFVGGIMTQFGYVGALARYLAAEQSPIAQDATNDFVDGTQDSIRKMAKAVAQGVDDARRERR